MFMRGWSADFSPLKAMQVNVCGKLSARCVFEALSGLKSALRETFELANHKQGNLVCSI